MQDHSTALAQARTIRGVLAMMVVTTGVLVSPCHANGMNPSKCRSLQSEYQLLESNGFSFYLDSESWAALDTAANYHDSTVTTTYRQRIATVTTEARAHLVNISDTSDAPFELALKHVPMVCSNGGNDHFAYSGDCAGDGKSSSGCVYTTQFKQLFSELTGSWLLHEYGHVFHLALGAAGSTLDGNDSRYSKVVAVDTAYDNAPVSTVTAKYPSKPYPGNEYYWYAFTHNSKEYFACLTEGYVAHPPDTSDSNSWPQTITELQADDPTGYGAVKNLWAISSADMSALQEACVSNFTEFDWTGVYILVAMFILCCLCCWCIFPCWFPLWLLALGLYFALYAKDYV